MCATEFNVPQMPLNMEQCAQGNGQSVPCIWLVIPKGRYFLYADEGGVHQLEFTNGQWDYLAAAA